jgi:hypothetical protein
MGERRKLSGMELEVTKITRNTKTLKDVLTSERGTTVIP